MSPLRNLFRKYRLSKSSRGAEEDAAAPPVAVRWVIAGLGNPGEEYARSRHNVGFRVIERLAKSKGVQFERKKFKGLIAEADVGDGPAILVKPLTYYNLSGECVSAVNGYFKTPPERLIVVHDDLDLDIGRLRLKRGGSDAGNRGVRSIAQSLGTPEFIRVRVGIGRPRGSEESKDYVLKPLTSEERGALEDAMGRAADAAEAVVREGLERAMGRFNQRS